MEKIFVDDTVMAQWKKSKSQKKFTKKFCKFILKNIL